MELDFFAYQKSGTTGVKLTWSSLPQTKHINTVVPFPFWTKHTKLTTSTENLTSIKCHFLTSTILVNHFRTKQTLIFGGIFYVKLNDSLTNCCRSLFYFYLLLNLDSSLLLYHWMLNLYKFYSNTCVHVIIFCFIITQKKSFSFYICVTRYIFLRNPSDQVYSQYMQRYYSFYIGKPIWWVLSIIKIK